MANILVACEFSGIVRDAFTKKGHYAVSCDILPSDTTGPHLKMDVKHCMNDGFDLIIAHPPCTYLCNGGNANITRRPHLNWLENRKIAFDFFMDIVNADCDKIAIENPIGYVNSHYKKPTQIIRPWMFGHKYNKDICLWLKNLPKLIPTDVIDGPYKKLDFWSTKRNPDGRSLKSITFQGIADAMAEQWSEVL